MKLTTILKRWQKRLRLEDWDLSVSVHNDAEYEALEVESGNKLGASAAFIYVYGDRKGAEVKVKESCEDPELYLIHELVHILLHPIDEYNTFMLGYIHAVETRQILTDRCSNAIEETNWSITRALYHTAKGEHQDGKR